MIRLPALGHHEFLNALFPDFQAIDTRREGSITMEQIDAYVRQAPR